jgi:hypothetical protein
VRHAAATSEGRQQVSDQGTPDEETPEPAGQIIMQPEHMAGVWANFARVSHSMYEFTLDFVRLDFSNAPPNGIVVARVSVSPLLISQLIDALQSNWDKYARKALPKEVYESDEPDAGGAED